MKVHLKVVIWQSVEVNEAQAKGIMNGSLSAYDLDGNVEHLFETEHQLTPEQNAGVMASIGEVGDDATVEVFSDDGGKIWSNSVEMVAGIDPAEFAKKTLVANGYVDFFVSSEEVRDVATDMQRQLTDEELADVVEFLSFNDLKTGISEEAIEGAISEICAEATDQEWEEDESDEFRHIASQYTPDEQ